MATSVPQAEVQDTPLSAYQLHDLHQARDRQACVAGSYDLDVCCRVCHQGVEPHRPCWPCLHKEECSSTLAAVEQGLRAQSLCAPVLQVNALATTVCCMQFTSNTGLSTKPEQVHQ